VLAILAGALINNSRVGDLNQSLNRRIDDVKDVLNSQLTAAQVQADTWFAQIESRLEARFNSIDRKLDELIRIMGDHDTRIAKLEERPR
jgi:hypothetical protein